MRKYKTVTIGGTFDHLHVGHRALLKRAFEVGEQVFIGLTTDLFVEGKLFADSLQSCDLRKDALDVFLAEQNVQERAEIIPINSPYGFSLENETLEAIVVTSETVRNAKKINEERKVKGLKPLEVIKESLLPALDNRPVSSTRIRSGEIDREGFCYIGLFERSLQLPSHLRETLRVPLGDVIVSTEKLHKYLEEKEYQFLIAVGDVIVSELVSIKNIPTLSIVDYKTRRKDLPIPTHRYVSYQNPPGTIQSDAATALETSLRTLDVEKPETFVVEGEEDLMTLPAIMFAPLNTLVLYGQHELGVVIVTVTEEIKKKIQALLLDFTPVYK